ncbi:MAG: leucine-rich repeat protein [Clostridia bacterium]|nr:leucine-rich repeat protein [Clostridia bacterium]
MKSLKTFMLKSLSLFLTVLMLIGTVSATVPMVADAAVEYTEGNYTYTVSGGKAKIVSFPETAGGDIEIPSKLGGYTVTEIGSYSFYACTTLDSVVIPSTVTAIGNYAFAYCVNLSEISIPSSVTSIGANTFKNSNAVVIACEEDSYAYKYAKDKGILTLSKAKSEITLSEKDYKVEKDEEFTISGTIKFKDKVSDVSLTWSCSDSKAIYFDTPASMLTVSDKEIIFSIIATGLKGGEYALTVTSSDGSTANATVVIIDWDLDTDGDGICDYWETYGIDTNDDGKLELDLKAMGADPKVPDIFVEVDWMVRPAKKFLFWKTQSERNMKPSESSMRMVYNSFKEHGINIHIDAGSDSIDFVTGKKWGSLSEGNEIDYVSNLELGSNFANWNSIINRNFSTVRSVVFRHCIFADQYNGGTSSGIANDIPGQYFIVANQDWVYNGGDISIAGTFMHELGHTLGLCHGGSNHEHYKPNYLSIMNYAFQTTGLAGTGAVSYSNYKLPDIDESNINESNGLDPSGLTHGTGLATTLFYRTDSERMTGAISRVGIDFNGNGTLDRNVRMDLNPGGAVYDNTISILTGHRDWGSLTYSSGNITTGISNEELNSMGLNADIEKSDVIIEKTLEESLRTSTLAFDNVGTLEWVESTIIKDIDNQRVYFDVINLSAEDTVFNVSIESELFDESYENNIFVPGSKEVLESVRIIVPVNSQLATGDYNISCVVSSGDFTKSIDFYVPVYEPTYYELVELKTTLEEASEIGSIDEVVIDEMNNVIENSDVLNCSCICHQTGFMRFIYLFVRLFWIIFGTNDICACGISHK